MKRWIIKEPKPTLQKKLSSDLDISSILTQLLINRNIKTLESAKTFLGGDALELYDPYLMKGMREAVDRLKKAIDKKEKILIHGDYDVDGVTAVSLVIYVLRSLGLEPIYYIPHRVSEGYGLSEGGVKEAIDKEVGLVLTVDCGICSIEEVNILKDHGIDTIITDHHEPLKETPRAYSIIDPHQKSCAYPDKDLSGVSVAFKLCEALCSAYHIKEAWRHLDLVALGTVSDVCPLVGENRLLVKEGLRVLKNGIKNKGLKALIKASGLHDREITSYDLGFILGPRINATGRIDTADRAVELLITDDDSKAEGLAKELNEVNRERQKIGNLTLKEAMSKIDREVNFKEHKVIVLHNEDWHTGVIGIVASRIADKFYRPCIMISTKDGMGKGSGRSIDSFHLFEALSDCGDILKEYGGHKYACGLTLLEKNLASFKATINEIANNVLTVEDMIPSLDIDMEIVLKDLSYDVVVDIDRLEPFGAGNPRPLFCSKGLRLASSIRILKGEHIKFRATDGVKDFEVIGFGLAREGDAEAILNGSPSFDIVYTASFNTWQGLENIQLTLEDIRPS
ncbi:MAG: single-stranded-DNA-specific exonuclease RecJ [Candidatus Omnitrophota bacterium]